MKKTLLFIGCAVALIFTDMTAMLTRTYQAARRPSLQRSVSTQSTRPLSSSLTANVEQQIEQQKLDPKDLLQARTKEAQLQQGNFGKNEERLRKLGFFRPAPSLSQSLSGEEEMQNLLEELESEKNSVRVFYEQASDFYNAYSKPVESYRSSPQIIAREKEKWESHKAISAERLKKLDNLITQAQKAKATFEQKLQQKDTRIRELENELINALDISKVRSDQIDFLIKELKIKQTAKE